MWHMYILYLDHRSCLFRSVSSVFIFSRLGIGILYWLIDFVHFALHCCFEASVQPVHDMTWLLETFQWSVKSLPKDIHTCRKTCPLSLNSFPLWWRSPQPFFWTSEICPSWRRTGGSPAVSTSLSPRSLLPSGWAWRSSIRNTALLFQIKKVRASSSPAGHCHLIM